MQRVENLYTLQIYPFSLNTLPPASCINITYIMIHGESTNSFFDHCHPNITQAYDFNDPRSPSVKRTPLSTPEDTWRQKIARAKLAAAQEDPRSPGIERTPVVEHTHHSNGMITTQYNTNEDTIAKTYTEPITPLTLSYEDCQKLSYDPRSPMAFRTPLNYTQGIIQCDTTVVTCPSFTDDTVIVSNGPEPSAGIHHLSYL